MQLDHSPCVSRHTASTTTSSSAQLIPHLQAPPVKRRLAAFVYEGVLLFGVVMLAGFVYGVITDQRHALQGQRGLQWAVFVVLGLYFAGFWSRQGQTLAMKTWHIRLVGHDGRPTGLWRAVARYLLSWIWFVPALVYVEIQGLRSGGMVSLALLAGVMVYAALSRFLPGRQFLHDCLCGTRLIDTRPERVKSEGGPPLPAST